ncbi:uncharacterized protein N7515_004966 [Penicillium bovifimosum]|uniref:Uncharacterized protein n=1 Tax=Penicillium bovifimosum TaxID=126998 RepID=A0A9W9H1H8_9EURO|nr:uncharacterized protein N7515_004966 [Penicillium bovifimosum]KAJ5135688.1 hypothetical protein N7515_004966 [Penicillium bovifimosum]
MQRLIPLFFAAPCRATPYDLDALPTVSYRRRRHPLQLFRRPRLHTYLLEPAHDTPKRPDASYRIHRLRVQPHRDVLHLNWSRLCYASWGVDSDVPAWVDEFLLLAKNLGMRPSITADLIHFFCLKTVLDCAGDEDLLYSHNRFHEGIFP